MLRRALPIARAKGFSLPEALLTLGLIGVLCVCGIASIDPGAQDLTAAEHELRASVQQAFILAHARGRSIRLEAAGTAPHPDVIPLHLGRKVRWGKPPHIPLPPGMEDPKRADEKGEAHPQITVTPRHTATASAWFLHDGQDALCLRLSGKGSMRMLRWRKALGTWTLV